MPSLLEATGRATSRDDLLRQLATSRGFYVPSFYDVRYGADGTIDAFVPRAGTGAPPVVKKAAVKTTEALDPPATSIFTPDTEFGSRFLVEVVRGCANLCRFCWAGYNYLPVRAFPTDRILEMAQAARTSRQSCRAGLDCALRSPRHRAPPDPPWRDGLFDQPGLAAPRRPDPDHRPAAAAERRAHADDRAGNRFRPAAAGDQQDRDQRRDPGEGRAHLLPRVREPEALLHDRPADRDRRRPGGVARPDRAAARHHAEARGERAARSAASSAA